MNTCYNGNYFSVFSLSILNPKVTCKSIGLIRLANRHTDRLQTVNETLHSLHCNHFYLNICMVSNYIIYMCRAIKGGELAKPFEQWLVNIVITLKTDRPLTISISFVNLFYC
jgi:hypothetical protein